MNTKWRGYSVYLALALLVFAVSACRRERGVEAAREEAGRTLLPAEQQFLTDAIRASVTEVDMARLALEKSQNEDVKNFAGMMQHDHTSVLQDFADIAQQKGMPLPNLATDEMKQNKERLSALSGSDFDREFVNMMVASHQKSVDMFRDQANTAQNEDVKRAVSDKLPSIETHLAKALELQSKLFTSKPTD